MNRQNTLAATAAGVALAALAAGCGGPSYSASTTGASSASTKSASGRATIAAGRTLLGRVLVDGRGRTLYLFQRDTGRRSTCSGACASAWPPVLTSGLPNAVRGADHAKLGLTRRRDGKLQAVYADHPLYRFSGADKPGQTNGEGVDEFGGKWYVVAPFGVEIQAYRP